MGILGSKCKSKADETDVSDNVKYQKLNNSDDDHVREENKKKRKGMKAKNEGAATNESSSWENFTGVNHMEDCKHSKSMSLTTQVSPKSNASTDGDDVGSISTLTSMLENPLLKRVKPDNPLFKRADGELRPVGPVHPWKLGKDKNQIRHELEENGLLKSIKSENYKQKVDPKEEGIIGDLRGVGIITHDTETGAMTLTNEFERRLPTRLTHLPLEVAPTQMMLNEKSALKPKLKADPAISTSEEGTGGTLMSQTTTDQPTSDKKENDDAICSQFDDVTFVKKGNDVIDLKIKMLDTEIL